MTNKNNTSQDLIVKSNKLIEAKYRLSLIECRIVLKLSSCIQQNDEDFKDYNFIVSDLLKEFGMNKEDYKKIKNATYSLLKRAMRIKDIERSEELQISFLSSARYFEKKGTVNLKFDPDLKPFLLQLKKNFTSYQLKYIEKLKSTYSMRFYELLKQYVKIGYRKVDLIWLKEWLGIGKKEYRLYADFKRKTILVAQKELKKKTDINFKFNEIKQGKKVVALEFFIIENPRFSSLAVSVNQSLIKELISYFKVGEKTAKQILKKYDETHIRRNLEYVKKKYENGEIKKNLGGYARKAIEENYCPEKSSSELKHDTKNTAKEVKRKIELNTGELIQSLREKFNKSYDTKTDELIENLSKSQKENYLKEFEKKTNDLLIKRDLKTKGLKSISVMVDFSKYLAEKLLKPEEYKFTLWAKAQGYPIKEIQVNDKKEYCLLDNKVL